MACPYDAVKKDEEKRVSVVNQALCKGCGTCAAACPSGAMKGKHFSTDQILAEILAAFAA
jgi:heterodisulfide reductase subunit A